MGKKILKIIAGCGCGIFLLLCVVIIVASATRKSDPKKLAALQAQADESWRHLAGLADAVRAFAGGEAVCGDLPSDSQQPRLRLIAADDLKNFNPDPRPSGPQTWSWLDHFLFYDGTLAPKTFASEREANDTIYKLDGLAAKNQLGVIQIQNLQLPVKNADGFRAGSIRGSLLVVDLKTDRVICSAPFQAESNSEVTYKARGMLAKDAEQAIRDDFQQVVKNGLQTALTRILPKYAIDGVANPPKP